MCLQCRRIHSCTWHRLPGSQPQYRNAGALGARSSGVAGYGGMMEDEVPYTPDGTHLEEVVHGSTPP